MTQPTSEGLKLIMEFEGFREQAYPDPLHGWKQPTIGYGTTRYTNGNQVQQSDTITHAQAQAELTDYVQKRIYPALQQIPYFNEMTPEMLGALESFAYNLGEHFYGGPDFQTITRVLRNKDWPQMRSALMLYVNPGTSVEAGLRRRRSAEADLWEQGLRKVRKV